MSFERHSDISFWWEKEKDGKPSIVKLLVPIRSRGSESVFPNLMSRALKSEQKEAISTLISGKDLLAVLLTGFWKSLIFQVLVLRKEIMTRNL